MKQIIYISYFLFFVLISCSSQKKDSINNTKIVKGIVFDKIGTLPGATIEVKHSLGRTNSDIDGKFEIEVKKGEVLVVSIVGMKTKEIKITSKNYYKIILEDVVKRRKTRESRRELRQKGYYSWPDSW